VILVLVPPLGDLPEVLIVFVEGRVRVNRALELLLLGRLYLLLLLIGFHYLLAIDLSSCELSSQRRYSSLDELGSFKQASLERLVLWLLLLLLLVIEAEQSHGCLMSNDFFDVHWRELVTHSRSLVAGVQLVHFQLLLVQMTDLGVFFVAGVLLDRNIKIHDIIVILLLGNMLVNLLRMQVHLLRVNIQELLLCSYRLVFGHFGDGHLHYVFGSLLVLDRQELTDVLFTGRPQQ